MKRNEIVEKLIKEGFSEKTLVKFTDKQLLELSERMLGEQDVTSQKWGSGTLIRLPKGSNNTNDAIRIQSDLKGDKNSVIIAVQSNKKVRSEIKGIADIKNVFNTVESILGNKFYDRGNWSINSGIVDSNAYNKIVKLLSSLGVDEKNNTFTNQSSSLNEQPTDKGAVIMKKGANPIDIKRVTDTGTNVELREKKKEVSEDKKCNDCGCTKSECKCKKSNIKEWMNKLAEDNFHSFTSKNEIMELVKTKLNEVEVGPNVKKGHNGIPEFMSYDSISNTEVEESSPTTKPAPTKPKVNPGTKPKTPYQPGPGKNPKPKALKEKENANK